MAENIVTGGELIIPTEQNKQQQTNEPVTINQAPKQQAPAVEQYGLSQTPVLQPETVERTLPLTGIRPAPVVNMPAQTPEVQQLFHDVGSTRLRQWRAFQSQVDQEAQNQGIRYVDHYNSFQLQPAPLLTIDTGRQLAANEQALADRRARTQGWDALDWEFSDWGNRPAQLRPAAPIDTSQTLQPLPTVQENRVPAVQPYETFLETGNLTSYYTGEQYQAPLPPNQILQRLQRRGAPGYETASFPGAQLLDRAPDATVDSSRSVVGGEPSRSSATEENIFTGFARDWWQRSKTQVEIITGIARDIISWDRGNTKQRDAWERVKQGDIQALRDLLPNTTAPLSRGLQNAAPVPSDNALAPYSFDPAAGQFGEAGRGVTGAAVYALGLTENLVWAGIYGAGDLANAVGNAVGIDLPIITNVPDEGTPRGIFYRVSQALSGTDLSLLNVRDGQYDRYLSIIDPNASLPENIARGIIGFGASAVLGGWTDNAVRAARRAFVQDAGQVVGRTLGNIPELSTDASKRFQAATGATFDDMFSTVQELGRNPTADIPVPEVVRRSNDELAALAADNGDIPAGAGLSNADLQVLQSMPDGAIYNRFGIPITDELLTESAPLPNRLVSLTESDAIDATIRREIVSADPDLIRASIQQYDRTLYSDKATLQWFLYKAPDSLVPVRNIDTQTVDLAQTYLRSSDELTSTGRGLQELEQTMENMRWEILRQSKRLRGDLGLLARGSIADEIATRLNLSAKDVPGVEVRPLYPSIEPTKPTRAGLFHGTRQADIGGIDLREGAAHEYGVGLYMSRDVEVARKASKAARVRNNPVPGTTRLGEPMVWEVNPQLENTLNLTNVRAVHPDVMDIYYEEARNVLGLTRQDIKHQGSSLQSIWFDARASFARKRSAPVNELRYRDFSIRFARRLSEELGIDGLEDVQRGIVVALPKGATGQIQANPVIRETLSRRSTKESFYARQQLDAEMHKSLKHPVSEAWERQSRVQYESSLLQDIVKTYTKEARENNRELNQLIQDQDELRKHTLEVNEQSMNELKNPRQVPNEIAPYTEVDLDEPCM